MRELGTDKSLQFLLSKKRFKTKFFFRNERAFQCFLPVAPVPKKKSWIPKNCHSRQSRFRYILSSEANINDTPTLVGLY